MKPWDEALPKAAVVRGALRAATDRLAAELSRPTEGAPDWNDFEWRAAMAVSVMHGITALLAARLRWQGPDAWQALLIEQAEQGRRRERRIRALLAALDQGARAAGLPLQALKGSALLRLGVYAEGERPMSDVDLLGSADAVEPADRVICAAGYERGIHKRRHLDYNPLQANAVPAFGEHENNPIKIELHEAVREPLPAREVDITAELRLPAARPGLNTYASLGALMRHLLLHAAGNLCDCSVRLIQLHDIAALAPRLGAADWDETLALPAWWAAPPLQLVQKLFPDCLPQAAQAPLQRAAAACPPWLRHASLRWGLTDVSLSRLGIPMLPGIEWSHSAGEALGLAWRRLHPEREAQAAALLQRQHSLAGSTWTRRPHWQKALSFLLGAPPRAQTLYSLHRALAYRPTSPA